MSISPLLLLNIVGLTPRHIGTHTPRLASLAAHTPRPLSGVLPAVTCAAQASILTGTSPATHGIVGNGWLYRDTREVRFWQQSRALIQAETLYDAARAEATRRGDSFTAFKSFWWFNQGAAVDYSLTPKPWYGADGNKAFGVHGEPASLVADVQATCGAFPFAAFWGPLAGLASTDWIARASAKIIREKRPTLSLVYLPHLDYDLQRHGASAACVPERLREVDACAGEVIDAARAIGAAVMVVSEYGIGDVQQPVHINRILREAGFLVVRDGPFGEVLETFHSRAFAVADHQLAHVYVRDAKDLAAVRETLTAAAGVARVVGGDERVELGLAHERAGELIALADTAAWFTYYYWLDERRAPDFAPTVNIHAKPGYDPAELFFDPACCCPKVKAGWRLLQKKLGFRTLFNVIPPHGNQVRGSHGLRPTDPQDGAIFLSTLTDAPESVSMLDIKALSLAAMGLT